MGDALDLDAFRRIKRSLALDACKWDAQVGDVATLLPFPLQISRRAWTEIARIAEMLTSEALAAERELGERCDLHRLLAVPRSLRRELRRAERAGWSPTAVRVMRFDFHWTEDGWRISEVNSDVPGGFCEASHFTQAVAACARGRIAGDPALLWTEGIVRATEPKAAIALLSAPGYLEDHQVTGLLGRMLRTHDRHPHLVAPQQIRWVGGNAEIESAWYNGPVGTIVRFYQAEWLAALDARDRWAPLFVGGRTPLANPGVAVLVESKRFALTWGALRTPLPTWRRFLPMTSDPRDATSDDGVVFKMAYGNTGDTVCVRELMSPAAWRRARWRMRLSPGQWVAQERFKTLAVESSLGPLYPCIGVFTIDGNAAGAYARVSPRPVIDYAAIDAALLVQDP
jgi:glutathionylspermidine synthase